LNEKYIRGASLFQKKKIEELIKNAVSAGIKAEVLVLTHDDFDGYVSAIYLHHCRYLIKEFKDLGIKRLCWSDDVLKNHIEVSANSDIPEDVESLWFK
jgi:hypothetical protein